VCAAQARRVRLVGRRASFVGRFGSIVLVVGLFSVFVFVAVLALVSAAQFETCAKPEWDARKTGALWNRRRHIQVVSHREREGDGSIHDDEMVVVFCLVMEVWLSGGEGGMLVYV
jgi:hypothetical protein